MAPTKGTQKEVCVYKFFIDMVEYIFMDGEIQLF